MAKQKAPEGILRLYEWKPRAGYVPAKKNNWCPRELPTNPTLDAVPASNFAPWLKDARIAFVVVQNPPTRRHELDRHRVVDEHHFPPEGANFIYENGKTNPRHLPKLVAKFEAMGARVSPELKQLLK